MRAAAPGWSTHRSLARCPSPVSGPAGAALPNRFLRKAISIQRGQHALEPLHGPIDLLAGDDQRRRDSDDVVVGLLAQQALAPQRLAEAPRPAGRRLELDADPQPLAAHFFDVGRSDGAEALEEVGAQARRVVDHAL